MAIVTRVELAEALRGLMSFAVLGAAGERAAAVLARFDLELLAARCQGDVELPGSPMPWLCRRHLIAMAVLYPVEAEWQALEGQVGGPMPLANGVEQTAVCPGCHSDRRPWRPQLVVGDLVEVALGHYRGSRGVLSRVAWTVGMRPVLDILVDGDVIGHGLLNGGALAELDTGGEGGVLITVGFCDIVLPDGEGVPDGS